MVADGRYSIDELADLGGVTRRTVRYYVQNGLLPAPLGLGRGRHYDQHHLDRLLQVKAWQEAGRSLDDIRQALEAPTAAAAAPSPQRPAVSRTLWRRLTLAPGVELHVSQDIRLPGAARLQELAAWCALHLSASTDPEEHS